MISSAAGRSPAPTMAVTARPASSSVSKIREREETHLDRGRHPEAPLGAHEGAHQVVAPLRVDARATQLHDLPVGEHHLQAGDVPRRHAVLQAVRPPGVLGDVAADRARRLGGRVGRVVEAVRTRRFAQPRVHHARLHARDAVLGIEGEDARHTRGADDHGAVARQRPSGEPRSRAARHDRDARVPEHAHDPGDLDGARGENDRSRRPAIGGEPVGLVDEEAIRVRDDVLRAHQLAEPAMHGGRESGRHGGMTSSGGA